MRVLGRLRLSVSTDESTSIERQREVIEQWSQLNGHTVVGWAEDVDVSGALDPFETPQLGEWLDHRAPEWDILVVWKLDRLSRNAIKLNKLFGWCLDHGKTVVSTTESIDLSTPVGRLIANVIAFLAEGELEAIKERARSSRRKLREIGRWPGGKPPYGYRAVPNPSGAGKMLEIDPESHAVVQRIIRMCLDDGAGLSTICKTLNADQVPTPAQHYSISRGKTPRPSKWHTSPLRNMLRNPALRGYAHHEGRTVRDDQGNPVVLAVPLISPEDWELVQAHLDKARLPFVDLARPSQSPLSGLVSCFFCGSTLHYSAAPSHRGRPGGYQYYRCRNRENCGARPIPADELEGVARDAFLDEYGNEPIKERVWVPGSSSETELREAVAAVDELVALAGTMTSRTAKDRLQKQLAALDIRIAELEQQPSREAHWEYREVGGTYLEEWERLDGDIVGRRELLAKAGMSLKVGISLDGKRSKTNAGEFHVQLSVASANP